MSRLRIVPVEERKGCVAVRLEGTLDHLAAHELEDFLDRLCASEVIVDFSQLRQFPDMAIPAVLRALERKPCRARGLLRHHVRMFRYFGHIATQGAETDFWLPEERAAG